MYYKKVVKLIYFELSLLYMRNKNKRITNRENKRDFNDDEILILVVVGQLLFVLEQNKKQ